LWTRNCIGFPIVSQRSRNECRLKSQINCSKLWFRWNIILGDILSRWMSQVLFGNRLWLHMAPFRRYGFWNREKDEQIAKDDPHYRLTPSRIPCHWPSSKGIQIQLRLLFLSYTRSCVADSTSPQNWSKLRCYYPWRSGPIWLLRNRRKFHDR
jgi:hypothetical protein